MILRKMRASCKNRLKDAKGFTLVEMIVVLAIIGILIALIAPNVAKMIGNAQETSDTGRAKSIMTAAQAYATDAVGADYQFGINLDVAQGISYKPDGREWALVTLDGATTATSAKPDTAMKTCFYGPNNTDAFDKPFMDGSGDALLQEGTIGATDAAYLYFTPKGAVMGIVYCGGKDNTTIKAVTGTIPPSITMPEKTKFNNKDLVGGTFKATDGTVAKKTAPGKPAPEKPTT